MLFENWRKRVFDSLGQSVRPLGRSRRQLHRKFAPDAAQLEDRVMLSAAPLPGVLTDAAGSVAMQEPADQAASDGPVGLDSSSDSQDAASPRFSETPSDAQLQYLGRTEQTARLELVFVDTDVDNYRTLVDDLLAGADPGRELEVYLLEPTQDGVEQISDILAGYSDVDAVHVVSHATEGAVKLGSTWLRADNLDAHAGDVARWSHALKSDADLMFYGCDLAAGQDGRTLMEALHALTGADVAASTDDTGHALYGADWDLEYAAGAMETNVVFSVGLQQQ